MKSNARLIEAFLDDRDALSPQEKARLAAELDRSPTLARSLKDQLVVRELVSQTLAEDRRNFPAQVAQRRRDFERGEEELYRQVMEVRTLAAEEMQDRARRSPRWGFWASLAVSLVAAVAAGLLWDRMASPPAIAQLGAVEGEVVLESRGRSIPVAAGAEVRAGDLLTVGRDATAVVRYPDRTELLLDSEAVARWEGGPKQAKRVVLERGGLSALVTPQSPDKPLAVETPSAAVRVVGTEFFVYANDAGARVGVTQGRIALRRRRDGQEVEVGAGSSGFASPEALQVWKGIWPSNLAGAVLAIESAPKMQAGLVYGAPQPVTLAPQGRARLNEHGALVLDDGAFVAAGAGKAVVDACAGASQLTVEAIVRPNDGAQPNAVLLWASAAGAETPNFALTQAQGRLGFYLKTSGAPAGEQWFDLGEVLEEEPQHVAVTYRPGRLACYLDGKLLFQRDDVRGDFGAWRPGDLIFGDQAAGGRNWRGVLEGVAIYRRALGKNEIQRNAAAFEPVLAQRRTVSASDLP